MFTFNNTVSSTTGFSPHTLVFGYDIELPTGVTSGRMTYNYDSYKYELQSQLRSVQEIARRMIMDRKHSNKTQYDKRNARPLILKRNDLVLQKNEVKKSKFDSPYLGPYRVEQIVSPAITKIRKKNKSVIVHNDKLKLVHADHGINVPPVLVSEDD